MLRLGLLTPEQAANHPARSQLSRTLGSDPMVQIDLVKQGTEAGDTFVLCSDGLWDLLSRAELASAAESVGSVDVPTVASAADLLVDTALKRGAPDNVTVLLVRISTDRPIPPVGGRRTLFRRSRA